MLIKNFYKILSINHLENQVHAKIFINKAHDIFKGHFPENPVVPGVCILQIVKELTEEITNTKLFMKAARNVKFKAIINPEIHPELWLHLTIKTEENLVKVKQITEFEDDTDEVDEAGNPIKQKTVALQLNTVYEVLERG